MVAVCLALASSARAAEAPAQAAPKEIVIVYKTHFDIGYSHLASEVLKFYRTDMIRNALKIVDQYKGLPASQQFVWTIPGWPMEQILWPGQVPEVRAEVEQAIRSGNLVVHAHPFSMHTETAELDDLVRGLEFSARIARRYSVPLPRASKMTDVPSHAWIIPTLLRHAGVEFLHIGCNDASHPAKVPLVFWWVGPDGSRLLTMYSPSYGSTLAPPKDWPYPVWLYLHMTYDNEGPPSPQTLQTDLNLFKDKFPGATVKVGRLEDFAKAILAAKIPIPEVRGDMPDQWVHGPASAPKNWEFAARGRAALSAAQTLATLNRSWGVAAPDPQAQIARGCEQSLLLSEHTWGAADQGRYKFNYVKPPGECYMTTASIAPEAKQFMAATWDEHTAYATNLAALASQALCVQMAALAANVSLSGRRIVVFNPLPWPRTDLAQVAGQWVAGTRVLAPAGGELPTSVVGGRLEFVAKDVPAFGYRTYRVGERQAAPAIAADCRVDAAHSVIESPFYQVTFDPARGRIRSIVDRRTGRELVDDSAPVGFQPFYERFSHKEAIRYRNEVLNPDFWNAAHADMHARADIPDASQQPYVAVMPSNMSFTAQVTPLGVVGTLACPATPALPCAITWTLTLYRELPQVDLAVDITDIRNQTDGWPQALWVSLPFNIDHPDFRVGRVGSIINPATDIVPGTNHRFYWCNFGVAIRSVGQPGGIGVCPLDTPGISLGEPGLMRFDDYVPRPARVFVNLLNNVWHTNFRTWYGDDIHARIRLWSFADAAAETSLVTPGFNAKHPLVAAETDAPAGPLPLSQSGLSLSRAGVLVTAFGPNPDGGGTVLRVWEQAGRAGELTVTLPAGAHFKTATPVNLRGESAGAPVGVSAGSLLFNLGAYTPVSYILE